jgi:GNAT superfamily N-acetyltransferase
MIDAQRDLTIRETREDEEFAAWLGELTAAETGGMHDRHLVLSDEIGDWIGGLRYLFRGGVAQILDLGIVPAEQGRGHSVRLLQAFEDHACAQGAHLLEFWTDRFALEPLLAALGWRRIAVRKDYVDGREWHLMEKRLRTTVQAS